MCLTTNSGGLYQHWNNLGKMIPEILDVTKLYFRVNLKCISKAVTLDEPLYINGNSEVISKQFNWFRVHSWLHHLNPFVNNHLIDSLWIASESVLNPYKVITGELVKLYSRLVSESIVIASEA